MKAFWKSLWRVGGGGRAGRGADGEGFDFRRVADVDDATVEAFFATTHEQSRRMPLLIAGEVAAELEDRLTRAERLDAAEMSEIRGGLRALRRFATYYQEGIAAWAARRRVRASGEGEVR